MIVEDGSGVEGADTFATVAEARAYAVARGLDLPAEDTDVEPLLVRAADYINSLESRFLGSVTGAAQAMAFPRSGVVVNGSSIASDSIPAKVKAAQCQLAVDVANGADLLPTSTGREVKKSGVGPLSEEFFESGSGSGTNTSPIFSAALALLAGFMKSGGASGGGFIPVVR